MHIPDGFLAPQAWVPAVAVSMTIVGTSVKKVKGTLDDKDVPMMGMLSAFIFAAQMVNFPVAGGTSGHFMGGVLAALMLGPWAGTLIMSAVLIVQCLVFQDGGLLALGANILNMGILGVWSGWLVYRLCTKGSQSKNAIKFPICFSSWISIMVSALACSLELWLSGTVSIKVILPLMLSIHSLIGLGEAVITLAVIEMVVRVRPDIGVQRGALR
jgi:cobalt/nickel transport system permease protein